jgi:cobalt-zinc-cadmium efflux system outer membrane protein
VDRTWVSARLTERTGFSFPASAGDGADAPDTAVSPAGELSEDDAVRLALRNNAAYLEQLAQLGLTRADVIQAGIVPNPDLTVLFPVGPKQMELTAVFPLEVLWLRDMRLAAARAAAEGVGVWLVQGGLDLIRDARVAHADLALARQRARLLEESARLWDRIAGLAEARVRAGDASPLDVATARVDSLRARGEAERAAHDADLVEQRFRNLIGLTDTGTPVRLSEPTLPSPPGPATAPSTLPTTAEAEPQLEQGLVEQALADRPDLRAAEFTVEAARRRTGTARAEAISVAFIADANERGDKGFEAGPGLRVQVPVLNQNQGNIARADAELERALRHRETVRRQVALEVRTAHRRLLQARADLAAWGGRIRPALEEAVSGAERAYRAGDTPLLLVLETNRQLVDARLREVQAAADLRRARAELERAVGRRVDGVAPSGNGAAPRG